MNFQVNNVYYAAFSRNKAILHRITLTRAMLKHIIYYVNKCSMEGLMKERSLLYFITALTVSILLIISLVIRTMPWFRAYGSFAMPEFYYFLIPTALLWVGWFFERKSYLLAASILLAVLFGLHLENTGILNGDIHVISSQAPIVRTVYVLTLMLIFGGAGLGFYTHFKLELPEQK